MSANTKTTGIKILPFAARAITLAAMVACAPAWAQTVDCMSTTVAAASVNLRLLVISADGQEAVLPAIKSVLDYVGIPYDVMIAGGTTNTPLDAAALCDARGGTGNARYQGVLLTTGSLGFDNGGTWTSALTAAEWSLLWDYEAKYRLRQATFYTVPGYSPDTFGLSMPVQPASSAVITATLTNTSPTGSGNPSGQQVFSDLQPNAVITISNSYTYLAAAPTAGSTVTPLLVDAAGHPIASINNYPDGRKNLALTTDGNPYLLHTLALGYGIVNWVTKGVYLGQRKVYLSAQPDDVLIPNDIWVPSTDGRSGSDATGKTLRLTASDYTKFITWQTNRNTKGPGNIVIENPFNADGATSSLGPADWYPATRDDLTPAIIKNSKPFNWMSHTYTHLNLDAPVTYNEVLSELRQNDSMATRTLKLANYFKDAMITPDVSGLNNPEALRAMSDFGIRYVVSNTSVNCGNRTGAPTTLACPAPNVGVYNDIQPNILMVPRYPANLFYNVSTPAEWTSEYNFLYRAFWGKDLSYQEVLGKESDVWLRYMLNFDLRPVMFHQPNMIAYNKGTRSLLGDLIDVTVAKFSAMSVLPPQSQPLRQIGSLMAQRMKLKAALAPATGAPLSARLVFGATATTASAIVLSNPTTTAVTVPITGASVVGAANSETYGGQTTLKQIVNANGGVITLAGVPAW